MRAWMLFGLLASGPALAWESEPQHLTFSDEVDVFSGAEFDTGWLPSGSPLAIRFYIASEGGASTVMEADSELTWPDALTHSISGDPGTGWFGLVTDLTLAAQIQIDLWGYKGTFDVWSQNLFLEDEVNFDPLLLPGAEVTQVVAEGEGAVLEAYEFNIDLFTGVGLNVIIEAWPYASASLTGVRIDSMGNTLDHEGATETFDVPDDPSALRLESTYVGALSAVLDLVLNPSLEVEVIAVGSFEVASFEIPIPLVNYVEERAFAPVAYAHPLPALVAAATSHEFGEVDVGDLANFDLALENPGLMHLQGVAHVEGSPAFSVYPANTLIAPGTTDGVVVTFAPTEAGPQTATLVFESSDPLRPRLEIPLIGNGRNTDTFPEDDEIVEHVRMCGCDGSGFAYGLPAVLLGVALVSRRARRGARNTR